MQYRKPSFIIALSMIAVLSVVVLVQKAHGEQPKAYLLVADCAAAQDLPLYMAAGDARPYAPYAGEYEPVCAPFVKEPMKTREYLALLRTAEPDAYFVFVYVTSTPMKELELKMFFSSESATGWYPDGAGGRAFIKEGFAVAKYSGEIAAHELSHLRLQAGHHCNSYNPAYWKAVLEEC